MFSQNSRGVPFNCLNRSCRNPYTKKSILGYRPDSAQDVDVYLKCSKCGLIYIVNQNFLTAIVYKNELPNGPTDALEENNKIDHVGVEELSAIKNAVNDYLKEIE